MSNYQKITVLLMRAIGLFFVFLGVTYAFISTISILVIYEMFYMKYVFFAGFYWLPWVIVGIIFVLFGKKFSLWICKDLD